MVNVAGHGKNSHSLNPHWVVSKFAQKDKIKQEKLW